MTKFVVVVLPDEPKAYEASRELKALHAEGTLTLYSMAILAKDKAGALSIKEHVEDGPLGVAVGSLIGGLVGLLGGPAGALAGMVGGALIGSMGDLVDLGLDADFVKDVATKLAPGKTAIVAEVDEAWDTPMDTRMQALGGTVLRSWRADFEDEQLAKQIAHQDADFEKLKSAYSRAKADTKATLKTSIDTAKTGLDKAGTRVGARFDSLNTEMKAKIAVLEKQAADASAHTRDRIDERLALLKASYKTREGKLKKAWDLTKSALAA